MSIRFTNELGNVVTIGVEVLPDCQLVARMEGPRSAVDWTMTMEEARKLHGCLSRVLSLPALRRFSQYDAAILAAVAARASGQHTYVVRNILASELSRTDITTAQVRRRLLVLEEQGKVKSRKWGPGSSIEWMINADQP